jgi:O-antigen ligase
MSKTVAGILLTSYFAGLYLSFNKTAILSLAVTVMVYTLFAPGTFRRRLIRLTWMTIGLSVAFYVSSAKITDYTRTSSNVESFTGRTLIWVQTLRQIENGPYIRGNGVRSFREIGPTPFRGRLQVSSAHNEFLNVWFDLGLVGVVLVYGLYFTFGYESLKAYRRQVGYPAVLSVCVLVFYLVAGITAADQVICIFPLQWLILLDCLLSTKLKEASQSAYRIELHADNLR